MKQMGQGGFTKSFKWIPDFLFQICREFEKLLPLFKHQFAAYKRQQVQVSAMASDMTRPDKTGSGQKSWYKISPKDVLAHPKDVTKRPAVAEKIHTSNTSNTITQWHKNYQFLKKGRRAAHHTPSFTWMPPWPVQSLKLSKHCDTHNFKWCSFILRASATKIFGLGDNASKLVLTDGHQIIQPNNRNSFYSRKMIEIVQRHSLPTAQETETLSFRKGKYGRKRYSNTNGHMK